MFTRHRLGPTNKLDCPHALGTDASRHPSGPEWATRIVPEVDAFSGHGCGEIFLDGAAEDGGLPGGVRVRIMGWGECQKAVVSGQGDSGQSKAADRSVRPTRFAELLCRSSCRTRGVCRLLWLRPGGRRGRFGELVFFARSRRRVAARRAA